MGSRSACGPSTSTRKPPRTRSAALSASSRPWARPPSRTALFHDADEEWTAQPPPGHARPARSIASARRPRRAPRSFSMRPGGPTHRREGRLSPGVSFRRGQRRFDAHRQFAGSVHAKRSTAPFQATAAEACNARSAGRMARAKTKPPGGRADPQPPATAVRAALAASGPGLSSVGRAQVLHSRLDRPRKPPCRHARPDHKGRRRSLDRMRTCPAPIGREIGGHPSVRHVANKARLARLALNDLGPAVPRRRPAILHEIVERRPGPGRAVRAARRSRSRGARRACRGASQARSPSRRSMNSLPITIEGVVPQVLREPAPARPPGARAIVVEVGSKSPRSAAPGM